MLNKRNSYGQRIKTYTPLKLHDDTMRWWLLHLFPGGPAIKSHRGQLCRPLGSALTLSNDDHSIDDDGENNDDHGDDDVYEESGQSRRPLGSALTLGNDDHSDDDDDSMINNDDGHDNDKKRSRRKKYIRWQFSKKGATWKHDFVDITHWLSINVPSQTCTPWKLSENYQ